MTKIVWNKNRPPKDRRILMIVTPEPPLPDKPSNLKPDIVIGHWHEGREIYVPVTVPSGSNTSGAARSAHATSRETADHRVLGCSHAFGLERLGLRFCAAAARTWLDGRSHHRDRVSLRSSTGALPEIDQQTSRTQWEGGASDCFREQALSEPNWLTWEPSAPCARDAHASPARRVIGS
jgi:hypothetical protein